MKTKTKKTEKESAAPKPIKLSDKHLVFCEEYLKSWNATEAYHTAYPKANRDSCRSLGAVLLANLSIRAYIDRRLSEMVMSSDEVLKRLSDMAKVSILPFIEITKDGFVYFDFSDPDAKNYMHMIKKIKTNRKRIIDTRKDDVDDGIAWEHERVEVELHDAFAALVQVGKYHKLFVEKQDVTQFIDLSKLSINQLVRLRSGEDAISVLANPN